MLYLASQSPRRAQLLEQIGVAFERLLPGTDESQESLEALESQIAGEAPTRYVRRVTELKGKAALARWRRQELVHGHILVSDTTVFIGGTIFGKPANAADAIRILSHLSGKTHRVCTAVALVSTISGTTAMQVSSSRIRFARLKIDQIENYVATGEPIGKAGAYAIQGLAAAFIRSIEGSYSGIMGLPLFETAQLLRRAGLFR